MPKKVLVSGCFDMLHSGHVEFFRQAAQFGDLYVALGSDKTIFELKGRPTVNSEQERLFMVKSVSFVKGAFISSGSGILDFVDELRELMPDCFVTNADGHIPEKRELCRDLGIEYIVLERRPRDGFSGGHVASWSKIARRIRVPLGFAFAALYLWLANPTLASLALGSIFVVPGLLLRAVASGHVTKNEQLTTSGPYAYTRNPLYLG